ncbi:hypothetical protein ACIP79_28500 [Streptomyces sp. NPDC088747]|uniref:hypothetical protein n=1 Tax=Streptomyces sp. NPDC088747 TaxID=3365886 RepID=UPI003807B2E0
MPPKHVSAVARGSACILLYLPGPAFAYLTAAGFTVFITSVPPFWQGLLCWMIGIFFVPIGWGLCAGLVLITPVILPKLDDHGDVGLGWTAAISTACAVLGVVLQTATSYTSPGIWWTTVLGVPN